MNKKRIIALIICIATIAAIVIGVNVAQSNRNPKNYQLRRINDGTWEIIKYTGKDQYVEIPSEFKGTPITEIGKNAFENCSSIKGLVVPDSIRSIGESAFKGCTNLYSITLPFVGYSAAHNAQLCYIFGGNHSDEVPQSLKIVYLSEACTRIGAYAFNNCDDLKEVHIPTSVKLIECYSTVTVFKPSSR